MDEYKIDAMIAEIFAEMETVRAYQNDEVSLTDEEKANIKKMPKGERAEAKKRYLKEANDRKKDRLSLLISALEEKIASSGLPAQTKDELQDVIRQAADNGWRISPDALQKVEDIKNKENQEPEKAPEKQQNSTLGNILVGAAIGATVAAAVTNGAEIAQNKSIGIKPGLMRQVGGMFMLSEDAAARNPRYVELAKAVAKKAAAKAPEERTAVEKRYMQAIELEENSTKKQAIIHEDKVRRKESIEHAIAKNARKKDPSLKRTLRNASQRPERTDEENAIVKKVNRVKQSRGQMSSFEIEEILTPKEAAIYFAVDKREHPNRYQDEKQATIERIKKHRDEYRAQKQAQKKKPRLKSTLTAKANSKQLHVGTTAAAARVKKKGIA